MDSTVTVCRYSGDLERETWRFYYLSGYGKSGAVLDGWTRERRATKRHKFKVEYRDSWTRLGRRYEHGADRPPVPDDVIAEALDLFRASVRMADDDA